ncbi:MAG: DUF5108 domain-containing protein [Odoribacter sp.]|nr:DUF5108 domain-containing protein [Odoribacter sp.]
MKKIFVICLSFWVALACKDPYKNQNYQLTDTYPTSTYLSMREDLSLWVEILQYADLYNAINGASESFTAFVPDNDAVTKFYNLKNVSSIEELGYDYARDLVKFHTIGAAIEQEVFLIGGRLTTPTLSEDYFSVSFDTTGISGGLNAVFINEEAQVSELAIETNNGFVYVLDGVLTPLVESIYDRLKENDNYSIMREAVELTRWGERLDKVYDTTYSVLGSMTILKRNFTLFAVTNSVFAEDGITSVEGLINKLGAGSDYTNEENQLYRYIGYHLLNSSQFEEDLFTFSAEDSSTLWNTNATNGVLGTYLINGQHYINYVKDTGKGVQLVPGRTDIVAKNGVLHEVDNYMPEIFPNPEVFIWDLCAYDEVISYVNAYGAENDLGDIYNVTQMDNELYIELNTLTDVYTVNQKSVSSSNTWKRGAIYHTEKNGGYGYNLKDGLFINVGYMGYVEMSSPIILKGKYHVELVYASASTLGPLVTAGGSLLRFALDNYVNDAYMFVGAPASGVSMNTMDVFTEVEFTETTTHTFRITVMDPKASTESYYRLQVDYVRFTPID